MTYSSSHSDMQSESPLCVNCYWMSKRDNPCKSLQDETNIGEDRPDRCPVCRQTLERYVHMLAESRVKAALQKQRGRESEGGNKEESRRGLDALRQVCVIGEPSGDKRLEQKLWDGWMEEGEAWVTKRELEGEGDGVRPKSLTPPPVPVQGQ